MNIFDYVTMQLMNLDGRVVCLSAYPRAAASVAPPLYVRSTPLLLLGIYETVPPLRIDGTAVLGAYLPLYGVYACSSACLVNLEWQRVGSTDEMITAAVPTRGPFSM